MFPFAQLSLEKRSMQRMNLVESWKAQPVTSWKAQEVVQHKGTLQLEIKNWGGGVAKGENSGKQKKVERMRMIANDAEKFFHFKLRRLPGNIKEVNDD